MISLDDKYDFSFTASSLRLNEMLVVAHATIDGVEVDYTNDLGSGKSSTGKRMLLEFNKRIKNLTPDQLKLLVNSDITTQKQLALIAMCKSYGFIRDFIIEVLREKMMVYDYQITEGDYISFYRRKFEFHDEMEKLTDLSEKKIKQVTFKVLEQAGIIDSIKTKNIQPQFVDFKLIDAVISDNPIWLKILLMSDADIQRAIH
jgi:hypothetical protein